MITKDKQEHANLQCHSSSEPDENSRIIFIEPKKQDIAITYTLYKDSSITKTGSISIKDPNQRMYLKAFHYSGKKFVWRYLDQYDSHIQAMSKELIGKLIAEL